MNRRALRLAALSFLLPVPVALAAPQAATLPAEQLVAMSKVPVRGVGDTVLPRVLPLESTAAERRTEPAASLTRLQKARRADAAASEVAANGVPAAALRAYRTAEATMSVADSSCRLGWELLAGIGRIESDHGRYAGAVLGADGVSAPQILGLPLNGVGPVAAIADTDNGRVDGDTRWDRAVGPMQFIPSTWAMVGVDGDGDGVRNPHDIDDAALAAAAYLCVGGHDLSTPAGAQAAVYSYNHSADYVALVLGVAHAYATGKVDLPLLTATLTLPTGPGTSVDLSDGRGTPIGASDEVSDHGDNKPADTPDRPRGVDERADKRAEDRSQNHPADPADRGRDAPNSERGDHGDRPHDDNTDNTDDSTDGPTNGTGPRGGDNDSKDRSRNDDSTDDDTADEETDGSIGGDGGSTGGDGGSTGGDGDSTGGEEDDVVEEEQPEVGHEFDTGTLIDCDETDQELTLCLDDADNPVSVTDPNAYAALVEAGATVTVIYHTEDGEIMYVDAIEEGTISTYED